MKTLGSRKFKLHYYTTLPNILNKKELIRHNLIIILQLTKNRNQIGIYTRITRVLKEVDRIPSNSKVKRNAIILVRVISIIALVFNVLDPKPAILIMVWPSFSICIHLELVVAHEWPGWIGLSIWVW